jgi:2,3-bisphosphoglycerate-dependent phosphoglycerate mutase
MFIPISNSWRLNERHYGALQGLDKQETVARHGKEQVMIWRRSYDIPPPDLAESSIYSPRTDTRRYPDSASMPMTESLKDTEARVMQDWNARIAPAIRAGKRVLITAHGNTLRALVKYLDNIPKEVITELNIPTGVPLVYHLDADLKPLKTPLAMAPLSGYYLGDQAEIRNRINGVAAQTK